MDGLTDLEGLSRQPQLARLEINTCNGLRNFAGAGSLPNLRYLVVDYNTELLDFSGLVAPDTLERLTIWSNYRLSDLSGLDDLRHIGDWGANIAYNFNLSTCLIEDFLAERTIDGGVWVQDNGPCE